MKSKRLIGILLTICMFLALVPTVAFAADNAVVATGDAGGGITWTITSDGVLSLTGNGAIPEAFDAYGTWFSYGAAVTEVSIGAGVTAQGSGLLYALSPALENALTGLQRYTVAAGNHSFSVNAQGVLFNSDQSELVSYPSGKADAGYDIPATVKRVLTGSFVEANNLKVVSIPTGANVLSSAFCHCTALTVVVSFGDGFFASSFRDCPVLASLIDYNMNTGYSTELPFSECPYATICAMPNSGSARYAAYNNIPYLNLGTLTFITRLYTICLGRDPDEAGVNNWYKNLEAGAISGAEAAANFFASAEYQQTSPTDEKFVTSLYEVLMDRKPDDSGLQNWVRALAGGMARSDAFNSFCQSEEFKNICATLGITAGSINSADYDMGAGMTPTQYFVTRLYNTCLSRDPDAAGLVNWTNNLMAGAVTGAQAAAGFFASDEYLAQNSTAEQFVTTLYKVLLNRDPSAAEIKSWSDSIYNRTNTRSQVFDGFCGSQEFKGLCASYGITAGRIVPSDYDMGEIHFFVTRLYTVCLGRDPDAGGLRNWVNNLQAGAITGAEAAAGFFSSTELLNKNLSHVDYVKLLYNVLLNRQPSDAEAQSWAGDIASGISTRAQVFDGFCGSQEFKGLCASYGITAGRIDPAQYNNMG